MVNLVRLRKSGTKISSKALNIYTTYTQESESTNGQVNSKDKSHQTSCGAGLRSLT